MCQRIAGHQFTRAKWCILTILTIKIYLKVVVCFSDVHWFIGVSNSAILIIELEIKVILVAI